MLAIYCLNKSIMTKILHIDASGRPGLGGLPPLGPLGSFSRRLSKQFMDRWVADEPEVQVRYRDIGVTPPSPVNHAWIAAAFSRDQSAEQLAALKESDELIDELLWADMLVIGTPMYNFGVPSTLKAWIDNIVRVRRTLVVNPDPADKAHPYTPYFQGKHFPVVVLSSRGDHGLDPGGEFASWNHLDPAIRTALGFIGVEEFHNIAVEHAAEGGAAFDQSLEKALARTTALAEHLQTRMKAANDEDRVTGAVRTLFSALAKDDVDLYRSVTTTDMDAFDLGHHLTRDQVAEFIQSVHAQGQVYEWNVTEPKVHIAGDDAWMTYINRGSLKDANGLQSKTWLESAVLRRESGAWKVRFLHSTESAAQ